MRIVFWIAVILTSIIGCTSLPPTTYSDLITVRDELQLNIDFAEDRQLNTALKLLSVYRDHPQYLDSLNRLKIDTEQVIELLEVNKNKIPRKLDNSYNLVIACCYKNLLIKERGYTCDSLLNKYLSHITKLDANESLTVRERGFLNLYKVIPNFTSRYVVNIESLEMAITCFFDSKDTVSYYHANQLMGRLLMRSNPEYGRRFIENALNILDTLPDSNREDKRSALIKTYVRNLAFQGDYAAATKIFNQYHPQSELHYEMLADIGQYDSIIALSRRATSADTSENYNNMKRSVYIARAYRLTGNHRVADTLRADLLAYLDAFYKRKPVNSLTVPPVIFMTYQECIEAELDKHNIKKVEELIPRLLQYYKNQDMLTLENNFPIFNVEEVKAQHMLRAGYVQSLIEQIFHIYDYMLMATVHNGDLAVVERIIWHQNTMSIIAQELQLSSTNPSYFTSMEERLLTENMLQVNKRNKLLKQLNYATFFAFIVMAFLFLGISYQRQRHKYHQRILKNAQQKAKTELEDESEDEIMSKDDDYAMRQLFEKLRRKIETEELYLDCNLKLADLAALGNSNKTYTSIAINTCAGTNVNNWLNNMRIDHMLPNLLTNRLSLDSYSAACGFASRATFYRAFKQYTGLTPQEYIAHEQNSNITETEEDVISSTS
ncbi:MAG: helix-turn-helix domain-containing protein [Marinifilaceae bacterium]